MLTFLTYFLICYRFFIGNNLHLPVQITCNNVLLCNIKVDNIQPLHKTGIYIFNVHCHSLTCNSAIYIPLHGQPIWCRVWCAHEFPLHKWMT